MKNKTLTEYVPYKVKDINLAEWGKKEIKLGQVVLKYCITGRISLSLKAGFLRGCCGS